MRVAINGFGRIGRLVFKIGLEKGLNIVAINDLTDSKSLAYLLRHDSVYGNYEKKVNAGNDFIKVGGKKVKMFSEPDPEKLPWKDLKIDIVIESTGAFTEKQKAEKHIKAGAKRVLITANSKDADIMVVIGANENKIKKQHKVISMASCTTNCLVPVAKVLNSNFGIKKGFMSTVHAYTITQGLVDMPKEKFRRGRAAAENIVPTTSGATTATCVIIPSLKGKMDGLALRVPVACGSIVDFVVQLKKKVTKDQLNNAFKRAAKGKLKGILEYTEEELVSSDIIENPHIAVVDGRLTQVIGDLVKVLAWYDNEYAYSVKMVDLARMLR